MSEENGWDLSLQIEGLSIRLRGLRLGASSSPARDPPSPSASVSSFSVVTAPATSEPSLTRVRPAQALELDLAAGPNPVQASAPVSSQGPSLRRRASAAPAVPEYPLHGSASTEPFRQRQEIALSFPPLPDFCVGLCRSLSQGELSPAERAERAWTAGCWARAVLDGRVSKPDPSAPLGLQSRYYCILRAQGLSAPCVVASLGAYRRVIGLHFQGAVSQGFPSTSECRVYFAAAGLDYPLHLTP